MRGILLVIAAAVAAFFLVLGGSFHFDDYLLLSDPAITSPGGWVDVWRPVQTRPLTWFTFWLNHRLAGGAPASYHAVNLALHAAAAALLLVALRRLVDPRVALIAALVFAVHPIQTEPVAYVYARGTLLCALLSIATLAAWLDRRDWLAVAAFAAALAAKEECVALPLMLGLLWFTGAVRERRRLAPLAAMVGLALVAGARVIWATTVVKGAGAAFGASVSPLEYASWQGAAIMRYLTMLVAPWGFTIDPELPAAVALRVLAWVGVGVLAALAARRWSGRGWGFWFLAGLLLLAPSSSILPANDLAADRRMYLPMIAFSVCLALALSAWRGWIRTAVLVLLAAVSTGYSWIWRSEVSLWTEAMHRSPSHSRPKIWLSRAIPPERALPLLVETERNAPDDEAVASEVGRVYLQLGRPAEALPAFGRALALKPGDANAINNRGVALQLLGQRDAAVQDFVRALAIDPCLFHARLNLKRLGPALAGRESSMVPSPAGCRYTPEQAAQLEPRPPGTN